MQIEGKVFVITGVASGLGEATCRKLIGLKAKVIGIDLNVDSGSRLQSTLGAQNFLFVQGNVTKEDSIKGALSVGLEKFHSLHGVINCAGVATPGKLLDKEGHPLSLETFKKVIDINLVGTFNVTRLVCEQILKREKESIGDNGIIINTASVAAFDGQIGQVAYASSKGAVAALTLPLARELARSGIRVMSIAPGIFETPMLSGLPSKAQESLAKQVPYPSRLGKPEEFALLCIHIIENSYLNGETIRLDGSIRLAPK